MIFYVFFHRLFKPLRRPPLCGRGGLHRTVHQKNLRDAFCFRHGLPHDRPAPIQQVFEKRNFFKALWVAGAGNAKKLRCDCDCLPIPDQRGETTHTAHEKIFQIEDIPQKFDPPPDGVNADSIRKELGIAPDHPVALYTGNFEKYQGIDLLMESIPEVTKKLSTARFVIVGGDPKEVDTYQTRARGRRFWRHGYLHTAKNR